MRTDINTKSQSSTGLWRGISWLKHATSSFAKAGRSMLRDDCSTAPIAEIVLEKLEMLDSMPQDVRQTMELQDTLADTSNGALAQ
jgi:hypothetical protein